MIDYLKSSPSLTIVDVFFAKVVKHLRELNKCSIFGGVRIKEETHGLFGRGWIIAIHITIHY